MALDSQAYKVPGAARIECPKCGTSNLGTAKKCFKCGEPLKAGDAGADKKK